MNYRILPIEEGPIEVENCLEENRHETVEKIFQTEKETYLLVAGKEMSTGGYQFELIDIQELEEEILVKLKFISPTHDQVVIQIITRPNILIEFEKTEKKITTEIF